MQPKEQKKLVEYVDIPLGWRWGFPKRWTKRPEQPLWEWLVEQGVPEEWARETFVQRRIVKEEEDEPSVPDR